MKTSITDIFVRRPVLALVVNILILLAGITAYKSLSVRQYPRSENSTVSVSTVYIGASAEVVRGFITTAIERSIASADGIAYIESKSLMGLSVVTARLELNSDPTKALADITARSTRCEMSCLPNRKCRPSACNPPILKWPPPIWVSPPINSPKAKSPIT